MKVGILGTGDVGQALGKGFAALGHEVRMGSRSAGNDKALAWEPGRPAEYSSAQDAGENTRRHEAGQ